MFVLLKGADGRKLLLNLDLTFCIQEGPAGEAIAIAISGHGAPTGEKFATVESDLMQQMDGPAG